MSLPVRDVYLEEGSILTLISDYFEEAGHAECLLALEQFSNGASSQQALSLPVELAALRAMVLAGRWDQVMQYLENFVQAEDQEGLRQCKYLAQRQKYLEILQHVESSIQTRLQLGFTSRTTGELMSSGEAQKLHQVMEAQLAVLEPLCPSPKDYNSLKALLSVPSISSSRDYSSWQLQSGRLHTLYTLQDWVSKVLCFDLVSQSPQVKKTPAESTRSCALLRLLAKGLLYEQCEELCRTRCGEEESKGQVLKMLDLRGWLQQQPDSSFQLPPSELCLVVRPWSKAGGLAGLQTSLSLGAIQNKPKISQRAAMTKSLSAFVPPHDDTKQTWERRETSEKHGVTDTVPSESAGKGEPKEVTTRPERASESQKQPPISTTASRASRSSTIGSVATTATLVAADRSTKQPHISTTASVAAADRDSIIHRPSQSHALLAPPTPPLQDVAVDPPTDHAHTDAKKGEGIVGTGNPIVVLLPSPLQKQPRLSSTPKNTTNASARGSLHPSPLSSPIVPTLATLAARTTMGKEEESVTPVRGKATAPAAALGTTEGGRGARKHIEFSRQVQWPAVTPLGTVADPQAVRSVAFSKSGNYIAVGANSGTLRVLETSSLLTAKPSEEMGVLYEQSRCHRGSIYCLAWYRDVLLASGSNDRHVSLMWWSGSGPDPSFKPQKSPPHKGTIRDVLFTPEGLLVYAGGVSTELKVTDIRTFQSVVSLSGHTDQVLTLEILPGGLLASGGQDKTILLWDLRSREPVSTLRLDRPVASLTSSEERLVTSHLDGSCGVFDLNTFKLLNTYQPHSKECRSVRFRPNTTSSSGNGNWVLSGSYDKSVCLTDVDHLQWTRLCQHQDKVIQCRWHPSGNIFASTGADKQARFWRVDMKKADSH